MKPKHWFAEMVHSNSLKALAEHARTAAAQGEHWNVMLYLAAYFAKQNPDAAHNMEGFADWRAGMYSADELMPKAAARLEIEHGAREKAAAKKRTAAESMKRRRQKAADEIWARKPHLSKAAVAGIIAEKTPTLGKAGTIADQIKKPPTSC